MATIHTSTHKARAAEPLQGAARALGLPSATALVIGSIIGTGVFTMPAVMAGAGTMSILVLLVISVGAVLLGVMFGQLTKRVPSSAGGLYAYSRHEFGDFAGFLTAWCYWITCWAGNAAIVASWVLYVKSFTMQAWGWTYPANNNWPLFAIAMAGLWIPAAINLFGTRSMAWFQNITVVLKFLPLLFVGLFAWFFVAFATSNYPAFNTSGGSWMDAVSIAAGVALFSFIGVEATSIAAAKVRDPRRNVGRATVIGTGAAALLYVLVTAGVMGLVPGATLAKDEAPFVSAFQSMFPHTSYAGWAVALVAVISGFGALIGWTLVTAEIARAAAKDVLFPEHFSLTNRYNAPWFGIVVSTAVASVLMAWSYMDPTNPNALGVKVFTYLVSLSVVTVAIPYFFAACAQLSFLVSRRRKVSGWLLGRDLAIAVASVLFSLWVTAAAGYAAVYQALIMVLIGLPIYAFLKARREREGLAMEPVEYNPDLPLAEMIHH
jgi:basic amino acid/polyamine antiporter, APA family